MKTSPIRRWHLVTLAALLPLLVAGATLWGPKAWRRYWHHGLHLVPVATGLQTPWAFTFLPDGRLLVTERAGRMRIVGVDGQVSQPLGGLPAVWSRGEGGLLDVVVDPAFKDNAMVYWSYAEPAPADAQGRASTAVARGRLVGAALQDVQVLFRQPVKSDKINHFGSRLLFGPDGRLFVGLGDRGQRDDAQDLSSAHGKILRIASDGSTPPDNPFVARPGAVPQVWSYGHRNVQGLAWHPSTGSLWASEHGPNGGDEINLIRPGRNFGWPVITYGCEYTTCARIGEGTSKPGMEQPLVWFAPTSVPPTAMTFLTSDRYPEWKGQLFVGTLWGQALMRLRVDGDKVVDREPMFLGEYGRVRDVKQGPDGWLYVAVEQPQGAILRLER